MAEEALRRILASLTKTLPIVTRIQWRNHARCAHRILVLGHNIFQLFTQRGVPCSARQKSATNKKAFMKALPKVLGWFRVHDGINTA